MLGENKKSFYLVDKKKFKEHFIIFFHNQKINKKNMFYNLHYAYSLASGENINIKKIIVLNIHQIFRLKIMEEFDYEVIYTIRNPIAALCSATKHWLRYKKGKYVNPWSLYFHIERIYELKDAINSALKCNKPAVINVEVDPNALYSFRRDSFKHRLKR